ncbi:LPXTG cell wall anchor domain-containing protein [Glycomyces sp. NRRL B-16210]|uniref:LPXTG cell wall anchor domain-containing protein n=1 Tax=Glycomyces sp. NRRL B-16210 TaxID=1463821 RepID=UPI0004BFD409|nr:LPXTG cell wall anchor domain-containing protein [Glycomyces sp. NRRL B-16210]
MNRTLKRVLGLTASVAIGLVGAVTFASAAQAHHTEATPTTRCLDDGGWEVTWSVTDWEWKNYPHFNIKEAGEITGVTPSVDVPLVGGIEVGKKLPYPGSNDTPLTSTQTFDASVESATLIIDAKWKNKWSDNETGNNKGHLQTAYPPAGGCEKPEEPKPEPYIEAWSDCVALYVWVGNGNPDKLATFTLTPSFGDAVEETPEADSNGYQGYFEAPEEGGLTVEVAIDGELVETIEWTPENNCNWGTYEQTCEGVQFNLAIPADGVETTFTFTTSESDEPIVHVLAPGDEVPVFFEGAVDLVVYYVIEQGKESYPGQIPWTPEDCESPAPSESETPSATPQLPTTGSSLTIMVSSAAALILAAAVIFLLMRRRRAAQDW